MGSSTRGNLKAIVSAVGFRPALRADLRFFRDKDAPETIVIHDPQRGRRFQLYDFECRIAKGMDGARDLDALAEVAKQHVPWATRDHIEKLTVQIAGMGLLANVPSLVKASPDRNGQPGGGLFDDATVVDAPQDIAEGSVQDLRPSDRRVPADEPDYQQALDALTKAPEDEEGEEEEGDAEEGDEDEEEDEEQAEQPQQQADDEKLEAWVEERPRWYRRRAIRRLVALGALPAIITALGFIPYPLYVTEPCILQPAQRAEVRTAIDGVIAEIFVGEGDLVEEGMQLARLDDRDLRFQLQKAEAEVERLEANLGKLTTGSRPEEVRRVEALVRTRSQDVGYAQREVRRLVALVRSGVASASELDEARRDLALKRSAVAEARAELKLVQAGFRAEEIAIAEAELGRGHAEIEYLKGQMEHLVLKAPFSGRVQTARLRERLHEKVVAGQSVVEIGNAAVMRVEILVPEREADVIQIGQAITLKVYSYPLKAFEGEVVFIAPAVEERIGGQRIVRVDARVNNDEGLLYPQMTGYAEIDAGKSTVLKRMTRRIVRWIRVRFLI